MNGYLLAFQVSFAVGLLRVILSEKYWVLFVCGDSIVTKGTIPSVSSQSLVLQYSG